MKILAPILRPKQDVICLGINYMAHAEESARYKKEAFGGERPYAIYFSKRVNQAVGDKEGIPRHANLVERLDYESELAVIILQGRLLCIRERRKGLYFRLHRDQ